jgi:hypothetical protein
MDYTWIAANWEWILLGFYTIEKIVKLSPICCYPSIIHYISPVTLCFYLFPL